MNIKMLKTERGSVDGINIKEYVEGKEYALSATPRELELARAFVKADFAVEVPARKVAAATSAAPVAAAVQKSAADSGSCADAGEADPKGAKLPADSGADSGTVGGVEVEAPAVAKPAPAGPKSGAKKAGAAVSAGK